MEPMLTLAAIQAIGGLSAAKSGQIAADAQNKIADQQLKFNNEMREIQQREIIEAGDIEAANIGKATRRIIGQQKVGFAGQGVDVSSEVAQQLRDEARENAQEDAKTARMNAAKQAWGLEIESSDAIAQNQFNKSARTNIADATMVEAGVSGLVNVGMQAYKSYGKSSGSSKKGVTANSVSATKGRNIFSSTQIIA